MSRELREELGTILRQHSLIDRYAEKVGEIIEGQVAFDDLTERPEHVLFGADDGQ